MLLRFKQEGKGMVHVEIFAPKLAKSGPVGAPWCSTTWQQDWRLDRKNAICAFYTNISPGSILLEARIWILSLHSVDHHHHHHHVFFSRKLYGPVKPGQEEKESRREEVTFCYFKHNLFLFRISFFFRLAPKWWSRTSSTSQRTIMHW